MFELPSEIKMNVKAHTMKADKGPARRCGQNFSNVTLSPPLVPCQKGYRPACVECVGGTGLLEQRALTV